MRRRVFLLLTLIGLSACATGVWKIPSYDNLPADKSGVAFMSVGDGGLWPINARFSVVFRPVGKQDVFGEFFFLPKRSWFSETRFDIQDGRKGAMVVGHRLPPGKYELYGASVMEFTGMQVTYSDQRPFSFQFEVLPGKATYLGEFLGYPLFKKGMFGQDIRAGVCYTVRDELPRDVELLRKHGFDFPADAVINSVMNKDQASDSIFSRVN